MSSDTIAAMANAVADADAMFQAHGREVPRPAQGETVAQYQRRVAVMMQPQSKRWKDVPLSALAGDAMTVVYRQIREDAVAEGRRPTNVPAGELVERTEIDRAGRQHTVFYGNPKTWMSAFSGYRKRLLKINNRPDEMPRQGL